LLSNIYTNFRYNEAEVKQQLHELIKAFDEVQVLIESVRLSDNTL
jgi:hypothetical protein